MNLIQQKLGKGKDCPRANSGVELRRRNRALGRMPCFSHQTIDLHPERNESDQIDLCLARGEKCAAWSTNRSGHETSPPQKQTRGRATQADDFWAMNWIGRVTKSRPQQRHLCKFRSSHACRGAKPSELNGRSAPRINLAAWKNENKGLVSNSAEDDFRKSWGLCAGEDSSLDAIAGLFSPPFDPAPTKVTIAVQNHERLLRRIGDAKRCAHFEAS